jgi:hypothetical protein
VPRAKLAELIGAGKLTREEAGELFRAALPEANGDHAEELKNDN